MSSKNLMTTGTVIMVMSMMICAVPAGRPPESLLIYKIRSSEGRGLTQAHRHMVKREATDWLEQEAPARASRLVLLLTKAGLELTRRKRNAQADPGVSEDHADTPAEDMPANDFPAAAEEGPNADGTKTVPERETKTQRRRKIRKKKIPGVAPRSGTLLRHGNSIVKVRRVKKRKKVPEGEIQGTQLRMGTAKGNGVAIRQGTAAVKDKTSRQGESYRQGAARQSATEEEEYYYYYEYYEDTGDSAVQNEKNVTNNNASNTLGQQGDGTDGYEDYYYYDESPDTESPGDGTEGQEGDGTEGDQDYYYDDTGGGDNADGGDGTGGQEGDGTDGDTEYYYDETGKRMRRAE
ncbi:uncharacterized protein LOC134785349 [Penaeus indicus]|uniref:uncharacterized protein LOC134785349 n=1 Tax=Penaeus indicus TaxID=29960 RepID=UPI00300D3ED3